MPCCPDCHSMLCIQDGKDLTLMRCTDCKKSFRLYCVEDAKKLRCVVVGTVRWLLSLAGGHHLRLSESDELAFKVACDSLLLVLSEK